MAQAEPSQNTGRDTGTNPAEGKRLSAKEKKVRPHILLLSLSLRQQDSIPQDKSNIYFFFDEGEGFGWGRLQLGQTQI